MEQTVVQDLIDGRAEPGRVRAISLPHKQPRILIRVHPIGTFWTTVIGKKVVMAATGTVLVSFVIGHMLGNLKIFSGAQDINSYARFLREVGNPELGYGELLWVVRAVLLSCVILHVTAAVQLSRMSWQARPQNYCVKKDLRATLASRTLRWGGLLLAIFIVIHLLHLTVGAVGFRAGQFHDLAVYQNVVAAFAIWPVSAFYVLAMAALGLHLDHGIWSACQTLGLNSTYKEHSLRQLLPGLPTRIEGALHLHPAERTAAGAEPLRASCRCASSRMGTCSHLSLGARVLFPSCAT